MEPTIGNDSSNVSMPPLERRKRKRLKPAGWVFVALLFVFCAWLGFWLGQSLMDPLISREKQEEFQVSANTSDVLNILLLGADQRENEPARSDTIILASLDLDEKQIHLLSIPRDTRVDIPGKGIKAKINHAHAVGGPKLAVETVEKFLDVPVHYYVETNFRGFEGIIDILGGITLNVEERMYLPLEDIDLKAGLQKLDGHGALSYVRWRGDGTGDIGRIQRQQKFFKALAGQAMQFSTIWKLPDLLGEINKQVKTDLSVQKMITLANKFKDIKNIELKTHMVPGASQIINGGDYWIADTKALTRIVDEVYDRTEPAEPAE